MVSVEFPKKGRASTWPNRRRRHRRRRMTSSRGMIRTGFCLSLCLLLFIYAFHDSIFPPGINLFSRGFWRTSHHLSSSIQDMHQKSFPILLSDQEDYEMIDHPGFLLADQEKLKVITQEIDKNITSRKINVPKFWNPFSASSKNGDDGLREFLGSKGKYLITKEEASSIGSSYHPKKSLQSHPLETIFVAVTSYRDPECLPTVEDLFRRAKYPNRIRVGIVNQIIQDDEDDISSCNKPTAESCQKKADDMLCQYRHLIDSIQYDAKLMVGPTFARHIANRLYRGEYFSMQVDSHVRFVQDWDDIAIREWKSIGNEMAVITNYMSDIAGSIDPLTHKSLKTSRSMMCKIEYEWLGDPKQHIRYTIQPNNKPRIDHTSMLQPFWAAGFSFARGHFTVQVPYDPYLPMVFQGKFTITKAPSLVVDPM